MPSGRTSKRALILERAASYDWIDTGIWQRLKHEFGPISESYLRTVLRSSGKALTPSIEGVITATLDEAQRTLCALSTEYDAEDASGRKRCRTAVIEAKQRLRWSLRGQAEEIKRAEKEELLLWVSTWLENPALFPDWVSLRRAAANRVRQA